MGRDGDYIFRLEGNARLFSSEEMADQLPDALGKVRDVTIDIRESTLQKSGMGAGLSRLWSYSPSAFFTGLALLLILDEDDRTEPPAGSAGMHVGRHKTQTLSRCHDSSSVSLDSLPWDLRMISLIISGHPVDCNAYDLKLVPEPFSTLLRIIVAFYSPDFSNSRSHTNPGQTTPQFVSQ